MIDKYENLIRKVILKRYPVITDVKVEDQLEGMGYPFMGSSYVVLYTTDECLPDKIQQSIDNDTKLLVKYFPIEDNPFTKDYSAKSYFDCGNGYEFHGDLSYKH